MDLLTITSQHSFGQLAIKSLSNNCFLDYVCIKNSVMYLETRRHLQNNTCMEINEYRKIEREPMIKAKREGGFFGTYSYEE